MPTTSQLPNLATRWLRAHHGVATTAELRRLGLSRKALDRFCAIGVLQRIARGVYVLTTADPSLEHRCRLLCCLHPDGFVTSVTAGMLEGLRRMPSFAPIHYCVRHGVHLEHHAGVRFRQTTQLRDDDWRVRPDGIVIASWERLAFDLAAELTPLDHRSVVHQLLHKRLQPERLIATGERLCHPGRRGSATFRLGLVEAGCRPQDSHPEVVLGDALLRRNVPIEPQVEVERMDGIVVHLDLAVPAARWGVELDIHPEHRSVDGHHRDARRVRSLHVANWQIEPVAESDMDEVERLADELTALYRDRVARVPGVPLLDPPHSAAAG